MATVRMINPANGRPYEFDSQYAEKYAGLGWKPATAPALGSAPAAPVAPAATAMPAPQSPHYFRDMSAVAAPTVGAGLATAAVPGSAPAAALIRLLASFLGGTGGEVGAQKLRGEPINIPAAAQVGGTQAALQGVGELGNAVRGGVARVPQDLGAASFAGVPASKVEGNFVKTGLKENIMPGQSLALTGTDKLGRTLQAAHEDELRLGKQIASQNPGLTLSRRDVADGAFDKMVQDDGIAMGSQEYKDLVNARNAARTSKVPGVPQDMEVPDVLKFKQAYDRKLSRLYNRPDPYAAFGGSDIPARYEKAMADYSRDWVRQLPGMADKIDRTRSLVQYADPLRWAESQPVVPSTAGAFATARDLAMTRENLGKAALAMRGPAGIAGAIPSGVARQAPRAAALTGAEIEQFLKDRSAPPDSTAQ